MQSEKFSCSPCYKPHPVFLCMVSMCPMCDVPCLVCYYRGDGLVTCLARPTALLPETLTPTQIL